MAKSYKIKYFLSKDEIQGTTSIFLQLSLQIRLQPQLTPCCSLVRDLEAEA